MKSTYIAFPSRSASMLRWCLLLIFLLGGRIGQCDEFAYSVVVMEADYAKPEWKEIADALIVKHDGALVQYKSDIDEVLEELREQHPRFTCFVTPHERAGRDFVAKVHRLTREIDEDPYTDTFWGILTGFDSENALAIAKHAEPLVIRKTAAGTEFAIELCEEGLWYDELVKNKFVRKAAGKGIEQVNGPSDTTAALVNVLNEYKPDLFVTSGHATERNWQIGFRYRNGFFESSQGQMFGKDLQGMKHEIDSPNAKVYLPIGNCLMGHIDGTDAMALAWMNDVGVKQMIGYTVPTWFGYAGWGVLDYFVEQPGRYTLTEAFFANQQALVYSLETNQGDRRGLTFDREVVAFYGDPAWQARMASGALSYEQHLSNEGIQWQFNVVPLQGKESFQPINTNGSQRGYRPIIQWLPRRVKNVTITDGSQWNPVVTDDFILLPCPRGWDGEEKIQIAFTAEEA